MKNNGFKKNALRTLGVFGVLVSAILFVSNPSWPTPDKLFIFMLFIFLALGQTWEFLKKFAPFVGLILLYESFRGLVPSLNSRVEYQWMIDVDVWLGGGNLPTAWLQDQLWNGSTQWYDFALYFVYMLHFVLPFALAVYIWKKHVKEYWRYVWSFILLSFMGFVTFWAFPAAPPWLASNEGYIEPITRISSEVWAKLGITDFPSVYNRISPNPVAAVPSLHAAYATLFSIFVFKLLGRKWGYLSLVYPAAIYFGTVYQGEHYIIDEILGGVYAFAAFGIISLIYKKLQKQKLIQAKDPGNTNQ